MCNHSKATCTRTWHVLAVWDSVHGEVVPVFSGDVMSLSWEAFGSDQLDLGWSWGGGGRGEHGLNACMHTTITL